jgi:rhamnulokinase
MYKKNTIQCLALDFGASSCRLIKTKIEEDKLLMEEIFRAANGPEREGKNLVWPLERLFGHTLDGLAKAGAEGEHYDSIGVDTWGVDYVLLDKNNELLAPPVAYRDERTSGMVERFTHEKFSKEQIYDKTGIQFMPFNTLFQLYAQTIAEPELLAQTHKFLFIADYFHFLLSGTLTIEKTMASTSQMWNLHDNCWDADLLSALALPAKALMPPVSPGSEIGVLSPEICTASSLNPMRVITPASHDTASAVLAVPAAESNDWAYLSSGTWSLLGVESEHPITSQEAMKANWTNEGGYGNTFRFLKNITGLWIIQEIAREFGGQYSFGELAAMSMAEPSFISLINPNDPRFFSPVSMIKEIGRACNDTGQEVPKTPGSLVRCAYDSLSLLYRKTLGELCTLSGREIKTIHVVGGGSQADFLNQLTASVTGVPVSAGPVEATAIGNAVAQFLETGAISSLTEARAIIGRTFPVKQFEPESITGTDAAYHQFITL